MGVPLKYIDAGDKEAAVLMLLAHLQKISSTAPGAERPTPDPCADDPFAAPGPALPGTDDVALSGRLTAEQPVMRFDRAVAGLLVRVLQPSAQLSRGPRGSVVVYIQARHTFNTRLYLLRATVLAG